MFAGRADIPLRVRPQEVDAGDGRQRGGVAAVRTGSKDVPPWLVFVHGFVLHGRRLHLLRTRLVVQTFDGLGCRVSLGQDRGRNEWRRRNADTPGQGKRCQRGKEDRKHGPGPFEREREHVAAFKTRGAMSRRTHDKCAGATATDARARLSSNTGLQPAHPGGCRENRWKFCRTAPAPEPQHANRALRMQDPRRIYP